MKYFAIGSILGMFLLAAQATTAQTLSLTPSTTTAQQGDTITFTLTLTPQGAGSNLFEYDTNIFLDSTYLKFSATSSGSGVYYSPSASSLAKFPTAENTANTLHASGDGTTSVGFAYASGTNSALRLTYDNSNSDASFTEATNLGTFQVTVLSALPAGGTPILLGAAYSGAASTATYGGSELLANYGDEVLQGVSATTLLPPSSAPEPASFLTLSVGMFLLGALRHRQQRHA